MANALFDSYRSQCLTADVDLDDSIEWSSRHSRYGLKALEWERPTS